MTNLDVTQVDAQGLVSEATKNLDVAQVDTQVLFSEATRNIDIAQVDVQVLSVSPTESRLAGQNVDVAVVPTPDSRLGGQNVDVAVIPTPDSRLAGQSVDVALAWTVTPATYADLVLSGYPRAYWRLGESSGTAAADSSGNGRTMTLSAATGVGAAGLLAGDPNLSWDAPGSGTYGSIADASWMDVSALTVEAWIRPDSLSSYRAIITRDGSSVSRGWNLYVLDGKLHFYDFPGSTSLVSGVTLAVGGTYHVALTSDGTTVRLYVNGALEGSQTYTLSSMASANALAIGASRAGNSSGYAFYFDGRIDEVAYYGTALGEAALLAHYTYGSTGGPPAAATVSPTGIATSEAFGTPTASMPGAAGLSWSVWNGTSEVPATVTLWNGSSEVAVTTEIAP